MRLPTQIRTNDCTVDKWGRTPLFWDWRTPTWRSKTGFSQKWLNVHPTYLAQLIREKRHHFANHQVCDTLQSRGHWNIIMHGMPGHPFRCQNMSIWSQMGTNPCWDGSARGLKEWRLWRFYYKFEIGSIEHSNTCNFTLHECLFGAGEW